MEVKEKLQQHIDELFKKAPPSRPAYELKEELVVNSYEKYQDLKNDGLSDDDALSLVLNSFGNVNELIEALPKDEAIGNFYEKNAETQKKSAVLVTTAVALYMLALIVFSAGALFNYWGIQLLVFTLLLVAFATCLLVYNAVRWPSYKKHSNTVVEDFKEWNNNSQKSKSIRRAISFVVWTLTAAVYLIVSFATFDWYITWIIFVIAACIEAIVTLIFKLKGLR